MYVQYTKTLFSASSTKWGYQNQILLLCACFNVYALFPRRAAGSMLYWSTHPIEPIEVGSTSQDTVVRQKTKQFSNVTSYAVSATSYALLCNMAKSASEDTTMPIQRFLQEQHMWIGGFSSTQVRCLLAFPGHETRLFALFRTILSYDY